MYQPAGDSDNDNGDDDMLMLCSEYDTITNSKMASEHSSEGEICATPTPSQGPPPGCIVMETSTSSIGGDSSSSVKSSPSGFESTKKILVLLNDLQTSIIKGDDDFVTMMVQKYPTLVNTPLATGWPPLHYAARFGRVRLVSILLECGANPNIQSSADGMVAAMVACNCSVAGKSLQALKLLLEYKADLMLLDTNNKSVLTYAIKSRQRELVEFLLKNESGLVNLKDYSGWTALDWAINTQETELVRLLISRGANLLSISEHVSMIEEIEEILKAEGLTEVEVVQPEQSTSSSTNYVEELSDEISPFTSSTATFNSLENVKSEIEEVVITLPDEDEDEDKEADDDDELDSVSNEVIIHHPCVSTSDICHNYGKIELLLSGLELDRLIPLFHSHDIKFEQFLYLTMDDLIAVGVDQLGARKKILQAVRDWHVTEWEEESLPKFSDVNLDFDNVANILRSSTDHIIYISSALRYVKHQLKTSPDILVPCASACYTQNPFVATKEQTDRLFLGTHELCKSLKILQHHLQSLEIEDEVVEQIDQIPAPPQQQLATLPAEPKVKLIATTHLILPVLAGFAFINRRLFISGFREVLEKVTDASAK